VNPRDYIALPVAKDEPLPRLRAAADVVGETGGGGEYLCYDCPPQGKRPGKVQPLPGVLDHREFERVKVELGRCDVCGAGKAVYRSREAQANICDQCYARLVREWNGGRGCGEPSLRA